jgi:3,4-dihydroxy 2-butanone 4-phosphate synthase/GTP cyclohydrolase II
MGFAEQHNLKIATIADLISYRRRTESIVERSLESVLNSRYRGSWRLIVYLNKVTYAEHIALIKGDITEDAPILVRMHSLNVMEDVLGDQSGSRGGGELQSAMRSIADEGRGVVVVMREPTSTALSDKIRSKIKSAPLEGGTENELRDYGVGAQILLDLGIKEMILLTNSEQTVIGLKGYGLSILKRQTTSSVGMNTA